MPTTDETPTFKSTEKQEVIGPDGRKYRFSKGISSTRIDKYFNKQGWSKNKDGKWISRTDQAVQQGDPYKNVKNLGPKPTVSTGKAIASAVTDYANESLPTLGGMAGSVLGAEYGKTKTGSTIGAGLGGAAGEAVRQIFRGIMFDENITAKKVVGDIVWEGAKQAGLEKGGQLAGEVFFKALSKIPHAMVKDGIPFLPSELGPNGKVMRYIEDLLGNLAPSANTIEAFKSNQSKAIVDKIETFAQGMANFKGTSEQAGLAVQQALKSVRKSANDGVKKLEQAYIKKGYTPAQAKVYVGQTNAYKDFVKRYENQLVHSIVATNKPQLIAGLLRSSNAALEETRILRDTLGELKPEVLGKVQNVIMRDIINETLTGSKDPVAKGTQSLEKKFGGDRFKHILDQIGEEKLKAIYGGQGYKNIEEFTKLVGVIGRNQQGSGIGRYLSLLFIFPFRAGLKIETLTKTGGTAFLLNRAAKMITSTEGIEITNKYVRATVANSPRLVNLAIEEIKKFNQRADEEYEREIKEGEAEYERELAQRKGQK